MLCPPGPAPPLRPPGAAGPAAAGVQMSAPALPQDGDATEQQKIAMQRLNFRMPIADRMSGLGTETAYAVSMEAAQHAAAGNRVYPFHIGDLNFPTPQHIVDACKEALDAGKTGYCPAAGLPRLRELIAEAVGGPRRVRYQAENVSVQSGGKPVILKFLLATMNVGDEVLYPSPGYPIYESVTTFLHGVPRPYFYYESDDGYQLDMEYLHTLLQHDYLSPSSKTSKKILVLNNHHNPLGICCSRRQLATIAKWCVHYNVLVLSDEPYFDLVFEDIGGDINSTRQAKEDLKLSIVSFPGMQERTVILYTMSKFASMTGWRVGAAIGPEHVIQGITKINTNDEACTTHFIQWAAVKALEDARTADFTEGMMVELQKRRDALVKGLRTVPGFKVHVPTCTFYLFVNVTEAVHLLRCRCADEFRKVILRKTGVAVCTREHFGKKLATSRCLGSHQEYVRFAYSGISIPDIEAGIVALRNFMQAVVRGIEESIEAAGGTGAAAGPDASGVGSDSFPAAAPSESGRPAAKL
eukprot:TRINITY_DN2695_c0_g3_i1.p1 TRINITY_DN2695_c0_g3~~TRINITY_DN2695_c0_g3_i1.p1  ORF type:complete len:525 (+),score=176.09 TRINITY_DN2695_c0_g3_i1:63-1637(+)